MSTSEVGREELGRRILSAEQVLNQSTLQTTAYIVVPCSPREIKVVGQLEVTRR